MACGSSSSTGSGSEAALKALEAREAEESEATSTVYFEADWTKKFAYTFDKATVEAGTVKIGFTNPSR